MREVTELLRIDPQSEYSARRVGVKETKLPLSIALTKGCILMTSGRLQGCIESLVQEFLENLGQARVKVDVLPDVLKGNLCARYPFPPGDKRPVALKTVDMHKAYHVLWLAGTELQPGMLRTGSLPDPVWNPWPKRTQDLIARCDVDLFEWIDARYGAQYLNDMKTYVADLIEFRNQVAHGDEPAALSAADVRLRMKWAIRMAAACDVALGERLAELTGQPAWP